MKRTPLKSTRARRTASEKTRSVAWWDAVMASTRGRCAVHPELWAEDAHHVLPKASLRTRHIDPYADPRNGMPLSRRVHAEHTNAKRRILRGQLPAAALEYAEEVGLIHLIERYYPEEDA